MGILRVCVFLIFTAYIVTFFRKIVLIQVLPWEECVKCPFHCILASLGSSIKKKFFFKLCQFKKQTWHPILVCIFDSRCPAFITCWPALYFFFYELSLPACSDLEITFSSDCENTGFIVENLGCTKKHKGNEIVILTT